MLKDRLKAALSGATGRAAPAPPPVSAAPPKAPVEAIASRHSHGLEQFFSALRGQTGLSLLDLSGASQANVSFITNLGHKLYSEDFLLSLDIAFGADDPCQAQRDPQRVQAFLNQSLLVGEQSLDGALVWDCLEYLGPELIERIVDGLHLALRPGSYILAFFHADEKAAAVPAHHYRIADEKTLLLAPRGTRKPCQFFNNRALEKLFARYHSVKFFLTRDNLREVLIKR